jgi:hypothetical protein
VPRIRGHDIYVLTTFESPFDGTSNFGWIGKSDFFGTFALADGQIRRVLQAIFSRPGVNRIE